MHETHIVFENLSNINRDMLQKAWGLNIGEDGSRDILNVLNSSYNVEKKREIANFRLYFNETSSGNGRDSRKRDGD